MASSQRTLKEEFIYGTSLIDKLESTNVRQDSDEYFKLTSEAVESLKRCQLFVEQLSLFSSNETIDDLNTGDIKYLPINYHLGKLMETLRNERISRLEVLDQSVKYFVDFLLLLDSYKLLSATASKKLRNIWDRPTEKVSLENLQSKDPVARRGEKMDLFKLEKSLNEKIAITEKRPQEDEEVQRSSNFARLELYSLRCLSDLEMIDMEMELLRNRPMLEEQGAQGIRTESQRDQQSRKVDFTRAQGPLLNKFGKVNRPFTIVSSRDQIKRGVFGTGQYLPTMTVDEYLDEERRQGRIIEGGGNQNERNSSDDEDNMNKQDEKTYKAREWDEFVEANPKGSGNTINRG
jgi:hypothetical protein